MSAVSMRTKPWAGWGQGKSERKPRPSKAWAKRDAAAESFYAYVLKLDDGSFYVGQTRELRERMVEHRDGKTASTAGKNPKLQYFEEYRTREAAMTRETELRKTAQRNGREIRRMVTHLQDLVRELDFS